MGKKVIEQLKRSRVALIAFLLLFSTSWSYYINLFSDIPILYPYFFYIPILLSAYFYCIAGGLVCGIAASLLYGTIALATTGVGSAMVGVELSLRIASFNLVGLLVGFLSGRNNRALQNLQNVYINILSTLGSALDARDRYTRDHSERVARIAIAIGEELEIPPKRLQNIERAARLHDLGKIGIPDEMLRKVDEMTEEEFTEIKSHVMKGVRMLVPLEFLREIIMIVRHHHERFNGGGYPDGLNGEEIELGARIITVADAFDAMTSARPYRDAFSDKEAIRRIKQGSNTQFDPQVVEAFLRTVEKEKIALPL